MTRDGLRTYLEISIASTESQREILIPNLVELGCRGFQETDDALLCYFDKGRWDSSGYKRFKNDVRKILNMFSVHAEVSYREIEETNWNEEWEKSLKPIEVGTRFVIRPSWTKAVDRSGRIAILIDPKMSFGTGYHESTRLILGLLETQLTAGDLLLDVGTGTGILAIAAVKLGARAAVGNDIDEWALENALENITLNGVECSVTITEKTIESFPSSGFDTICANIMSTTILQMLPEFHRIAKPGGKLLLSGILTIERETIIAGLHSFHFDLREERTENEWIAIAAGKQ